MIKKNPVFKVGDHRDQNFGTYRDQVYECLKLLATNRSQRDIDTISNLVFWSRLVNKLEHWDIVYIMQQMTKPSNFLLIDRLQFPWLTVSMTSCGLRY